MSPDADGEPEADAPDEAAEAPDAGPEASSDPPGEASGASADPRDREPEAPDPAPEAGGEPSDEVGPDVEGRARCPYCGSRDVVRFSRFGSEVSSQQYECKACGAPFERLRFDGEQPDTRRDED